jgi:adenosylmethionine-8-amino-7-oxononanoate aminotransferase
MDKSAVTEAPVLTDDHQSALAHSWPHSNELDWDQLAGGEGLKVFAQGEGCTLIDVRGRRYLDALAGLFLVNVGHGRAEIGEAMARQAAQLGYVAASNYASVPGVQLAETIASLTPGDLNRVFFCSGGSEAVESALKIARQTQFLRGFPKRYKVIARRGSYHGMTYGAMSLTQIRNEDYFGPFAYGVSIVPSPNHYRNDFGIPGEAGDIMCAKYVEQEIIAQGPHTVAAVIGEPISASNGTHPPSPIYWQMLREICDRHGVLLIMDEVINGFGRTGKMFAAEHYGVVPDIMTVAKGLSSGYAAIGAAIVRDSVFEEFKKPGSSFAHLLTFGGVATSAAAALANISILEDEELVARSASMGSHLLGAAQVLRSHPVVGDVRGLGLLVGIDLVRSKATKERWGMRHPFLLSVSAGLEARGVLTRVWDVIHLAPPLTVSDEEIATIIAAIDESLTDAEREFAAEIEAARPE